MYVYTTLIQWKFQFARFTKHENQCIRTVKEILKLYDISVKEGKTESEISENYSDVVPNMARFPQYIIIMCQNEILNVLIFFAMHSW